MTRTYTLKRRAEQQAETRQRIVEAAVDLHGSVGPAPTTLSMVAERAGVQRHTLYAHFPDERSLAMACSGLVHERDPLPDAAAWRAIADRTRAAARRRCARSTAGTSAMPRCGVRAARRRASRADERDRRAAVRSRGRGLSRGARREPQRKAARDAALGAELLHLADAGRATADSSRALRSE